MELFPGHWAQPRSELVDHDMVGPPAHGFIEILNELPSCHGRGRSKLKDLPCYIAGFGNGGYSLLYKSFRTYHSTICVAWILHKDSSYR